MGSTGKTLVALSIVVAVASVLSISFYIFVKHAEEAEEAEFAAARERALTPVGERLGSARGSGGGASDQRDVDRSPSYYLRESEESRSAPRSPRAIEAPTTTKTTETPEPLGSVSVDEESGLEAEGEAERSGSLHPVTTRSGTASSSSSKPEIAIQSTAFPNTTPTPGALSPTDKEAESASTAVTALVKALYEEADERTVVRYFEACRRGGTKYAIAAWSELQRMIVAHPAQTSKLARPGLELNVVRFLAAVVAGLEWEWIEREVLKPMITRLERPAGVRADGTSYRDVLNQTLSDGCAFLLARPADIVASEVVWSYIASAGEVPASLATKIRDLSKAQGEDGAAARSAALPWLGLLLAQSVADPALVRVDTNVKYSFPVGVLSSKRREAYQRLAGAVLPTQATASSKEIALAWWRAYRDDQKNASVDGRYAWPRTILGMAEWLWLGPESVRNFGTDFRRIDAAAVVGARPTWFLGSPSNFRQLFRNLYDKELASRVDSEAEGAKAAADALKATTDLFRADVSRHNLSIEELRGCADTVAYEFKKPNRAELDVTLDLAMLRVIWERAEDEQFGRASAGRNASDRREWRIWQPRMNSAFPMSVGGTADIQAFTLAAARHGMSGHHSASGGQLASLLLQSTDQVRDALNATRAIKSRRGLGSKRWDEVVPLIRLVPQSSSERRAEPWEGWVKEYVTETSEVAQGSALPFARIAVLSHGARPETRTPQVARRVWARWFVAADRCFGSQESLWEFGGYVLAYKDLVYAGWDPMALLE